jgi:hypothetical protein
MDEKTVQALLEQLAESDPPPSQVDVALAVRNGRKKRRWRLAALAGSPVVAIAVIAVVIATGIVPLGAGKSSGDSASHPAPLPPGVTVVTGLPSPARYANAGRHYLRPGFIPQVPISSTASRLVLQAPRGITRWTLQGESCSVSYTMIKKTPWGGIPGSGGGSGAAGCPWAPHLSLGAGGDFYSDGVYFTVIGGKALPARGVGVRVTLADNAQMTVTPRNAMWLVIVQRCGAYNKTAIKSVELIGAHGSIIGRTAPPAGHAQPSKPPC